MNRAAGSTPARAAQGMATTSCCGKFLPDRGQKTSLHRTPAVPNRPQGCEDSLRRIPPIPFLPQANGRDPEADCRVIVDKKIEPHCGIDTRARLRPWLL